MTDLTVKLVGTTGDAAGWRLLAPPAFLVWPSGSGGAPVVWDVPTQEREAPLGVLDAAVREAAIASMGEGPMRLLPPILGVPVPRVAPEEE